MSNLIWMLGSSEPSKNLVIQTQSSLNKTLHYHNSCTGDLINHPRNLTLVGFSGQLWILNTGPWIYLSEPYTEQPSSSASHQLRKCLLFLLPSQRRGDMSDIIFIDVILINKWIANLLHSIVSRTISGHQKVLAFFAESDPKTSLMDIAPSFFTSISHTQPQTEIPAPVQSY